MRGFDREVIGAFGEMDERVKTLESAVYNLVLAVEWLADALPESDWRRRAVENIAAGIEGVGEGAPTMPLASTSWMEDKG